MISPKSIKNKTRRSTQSKPENKWSSPPKGYLLSVERAVAAPGQLTLPLCCKLWVGKHLKNPAVIPPTVTVSEFFVNLLLYAQRLL